ncbi:MAG TPA: hypothetical protein IAB01_02295 [Candidatus Avidesulfovibrio excrementigallinarum]|nr:hypothetical protein [Candidatus Avidesulfovibrio excrementigallinarum]
MREQDAFNVQQRVRVYCAQNALVFIKSVTSDSCGFGNLPAEKHFLHGMVLECFAVRERNTRLKNLAGKAGGP